jgi:rhomboid protease GluP
LDVPGRISVHLAPGLLKHVRVTTVACLQCGALNGADFGHCIRCGQALDDAAPADRARRRVPAPRGRGLAVSGTEALLGRWPAEVLPVAKALLFVNMAVFAVQVSIAWQRSASFMTLWSGGTGLDAVAAGAMLTDPTQTASEPWRLLSACFVHFGLLHIFFNMSGLVSLSGLLEPAIGSVRLLILYVLTGVIGFAVSLAWYAHTQPVLLFQQAVPTAGASGAVFGLVGGTLGYFLQRRDAAWKDWAVRAVFYVVISGAFLRGAANNAAHVGGLVSGVVIGFALSRGAPKPSARWQQVLGALCAIAVVASLVLARTSGLVSQLLGPD